MRKFTLALLVLGTVLLPTQMNAYESTKVKPNFIKIQGQKYRRAAAESATIASIGIKRSPIGKIPRFERMFNWKSGKIAIRQGPTITLSSKQVHKLSGHAVVVTEGGKVTGETSISSALNANYVLTKFELEDKTEVRKAINADKPTLKEIKNLKKKARIVSTVWILVKGSETQMTEYEGTVTVTQPDRNGDISVQHQGRTSFSFSPKTVMAYSLDKFKWKKKGFKRKYIKQLKTDLVWR